MANTTAPMKGEKMSKNGARTTASARLGGSSDNSDDNSDNSPAALVASVCA